MLDSGKLILIDNNYERLGDEGSEFFGRLFLALIWYAARAQNRTKPVYVFVDEADATIRRDQQISKMITQLRSPKVSLTFAHQGLYQIDDAKVLSALSLCAIKFTSASGEATEMARYIEGDPAALKALDVGQMATWVRGVTKQGPVTLDVKHHKVEKPLEVFQDRRTYPLMDQHEFAAFQRTMWERYSVDPKRREPDAHPPAPQNIQHLPAPSPPPKPARTQPKPPAPPTDDEREAW
jgi:hypothetical protein